MITPNVIFSVKFYVFNRCLALHRSLINNLIMMKPHEPEVIDPCPQLFGLRAARAGVFGCALNSCITGAPPVPAVCRFVVAAFVLCRSVCAEGAARSTKLPVSLKSEFMSIVYFILIEISYFPHAIRSVKIGYRVHFHAGSRIYTFYWLINVSVSVKL